MVQGPTQLCLGMTAHLAACACSLPYNVRLLQGLPERSYCPPMQLLAAA